MPLDKWIALIFLAVSIVYGYESYNYELLPFERNMVFLPTTLPMVLSVICAMLSIIILLSPKAVADAEGDALGSINIEKWRKYKVGQALALVAIMIAYALTLRTLGFIASTTLFLVGSGWILGERKLPMMSAIALTGAGSVWYLVQEALGIFLRPLPWFITG
jgi:putative tricarboxylic transport membrane protein